MRYTFTRPGPWPGGASRSYSSVGFSQIALSGSASEDGRSGTLGVAIFNTNNTNQEDDTLIEFHDGQRLGVFLHTIINDGLTSHPTTLFRTTFDPFTPARFGTPIGNEGNDGHRLTRRGLRPPLAAPGDMGAPIPAARRRDRTAVGHHAHAG